MRISAVLKAVNGLLIGLAILLLLVVYWYLWRPLPQTSGRLLAPVAKDVSIVRDQRGVPHIQAQSLEDALFAQGYATAQDRLWQMDTIRRLAGGELSEVVGRVALESDTAARKLRLRRLAEAGVQRLPAAERALLGAYARGVNHYIESRRKTLPFEFVVLGYQPRPWRIADTLLVGLEMYRTLTTTWDDDLERSRMSASGDPAKVRALYPARSGKEVWPGSNAWAVSGRHTASGKPILANDPHLSFSLPSTWHMVHLRAPGFHAAGATLPGVPGVISGHNDYIAWGVTNLGYDVQDLYREEIDLRTGRYRAADAILQAAAENEWIAVKGDKPVQLVSWVTRHGPIYTAEAGRHFALRWSAAEFGMSRFAILALNRARNWHEFREALRHFPGPGQNFVFADRDGNIGYQATGWLPLRGFDGSLPADGASGQSEWQGRIPFDELPSVFNPTSGLIVSANENTFPPNYPYPVSGQFSSAHRHRQIYNRLSSRQGWQPEQMVTLQCDVYSAFNRFLNQQAIDAVARAASPPAQAREGADLLRNWNGQMLIGTPQPLLSQLLFQHVRRAFGESASKDRGAQYRTEVSAAAVENLLTQRPAGWFADWDAMLITALADAVDEGRRIQGRNISKWDWGAYNRVNVAHPIAGRVKLIAPYFSIGPAPMSGSSYTVKQTTRTLGPSMRFVADLSNWDASLMNLTIGESGHRLSPHFNDQWKAYYNGVSFPLPFHQFSGKTLLLSPR